MRPVKILISLRKSEGTFPDHVAHFRNLGPIVQSIVSLTSLLVVKMLTVLVSTIYKSQVVLLKKCE